MVSDDRFSSMGHVGLLLYADNTLSTSFPSLSISRPLELASKLASEGHEGLLDVTMIYKCLNGLAPSYLSPKLVNLSRTTLDIENSF